MNVDLIPHLIRHVRRVDCIPESVEIHFEMSDDGSARLVTWPAREPVRTYDRFRDVERALWEVDELPFGFCEN